ncbi:DMT family transporter [Neptunomonas antarctica]|uniref:EamA-like transporter family protein n=1 Tax=Neptunomonas antarctica TaxID=619304 RepID=A0A1N7KGY7_9GAMM|nr:DMT family transporter [Neptunomonas antarctica]SIS60817.1 EamA-like transporter family protein [Neptunomonas antarctica]
MPVSKNLNNPLSHQQIVSKQNSRASLYAFACLLLVGAFLALSLVVGKLASTAGAPLLTFLMISMLGASVMLCIISAIKRHPMALNRRMIEYGIVSGVLFALPNALGFLAIRHVGAGFISLSYAFPILITWLLAVVLRMERLRVLRFSGVMLALSGGIILAASKSADASEAQGWIILVLSLPVVIACGNIYRTLRWPVGASPVFLAALMMLGGAITLLPFVLVLEAGQVQALFESTETIQLLALEIAIFTVLYLFYFLLQQLAGPVYFSQIGTVAALSGTLLSVFVLGEMAPPNLGLAGVLVAIGIVLFQRGAKEQY